MDECVEALAQAALPSLGLEIDRAVKGGAPLKGLWKKTDARKKIASKGFDVVVLQEDLPETDVATFQEYAKRFHEVCRAADTELVLLMAWPYERLGWISTEGIASAHQDAATSLKVRVAPVGLAWHRALQLRPDARLYDKDNEHPAPGGTYLAACVVFATLWGRSPVGVRSKKAERSVKNVEFLQNVAWETFQSYAWGRPRNSMDESAVPAGASREANTTQLFDKLDLDGDGYLSAEELRVFEEFVGFHGDDGVWLREFACLCEELGSDPAVGLPLDSFRRLVDHGTERGDFCTHCSDAELEELLAKS